MSGVVVIGSQWGDEGKGKVVDWLSERADVVIRFQGGHNAGHTLVVDGVTYKLALLPSGVVRGKLSLIGSGVVVDPWALREEISRVASQGLNINPSNLMISDSATLILPLHSSLDSAREDSANNNNSSKLESVGTTRRGIGPAYEDKVGRRSLRVADIFNKEETRDKIKNLVAYHNLIRMGMNADLVNEKEIYEQVLEVAEFLKPYACVMWKKMSEIRRSNCHILFEGAQGVMLDLDYGTYPYVTSSNTVTGSVLTGIGAGHKMVDFVLGITKAYSTRVGCGPFPTEFSSGEQDLQEHIGSKGKERGTNTGRLRRCGWFDAVAVKQAVNVAGIDGIALTKLDILDELDEIKICAGYELDGCKIDYLPSSSADQFRVKPIYESVKGWKSSTQSMQSWIDIPLQANKYIRRIEELIGVPVTLLSTSPRREDTICVHDPFLV